MDFSTGLFGSADKNNDGLKDGALRDLKNKTNNVISVIGDGAMSAGMAYEAMNNAGATKSNLIVVVSALVVGVIGSAIDEVVGLERQSKLRCICLAEQYRACFP